MFLTYFNLFLFGSKCLGYNVFKYSFFNVYFDTSCLLYRKFTELLNKETKGTAHPLRSGFSTDTDTVNCLVNTFHIHALLRKELHKCLQMKTGSKHEELKNREIKSHVEHVKNLKQNL